MRIFLIAGEVSGDLHGALLARRLKALNPEIELRGWGGDQMEAEGVQILKHIKDLAFMGFVEVVQHLGEIRQNFKLCKEQITAFQPDVVVYIDYPGFNLRMTKWCRNQGYKNCYYISPQIWAWKENRVHKIKKYVDEMICILPFEKDFYAKYDMEVHYVGHPLIEIVDQAKAQYGTSPRDTIALIPGSRKQEVLKNLPLMLETVNKLVSDEKVAIAKSPTLDESVYQNLISEYPEVEIYTQGTYPLLLRARAAMVTSGTATLETALFEVPQMVCYRATAISVALARFFIKVKYISLVNLIMDRPIVKEFIQKEYNLENTTSELQRLLEVESDYSIRMLQNYVELRDHLSQDEPPSLLAAKIISKM